MIPLNRYSFLFISQESGFDPTDRTVAYDLTILRTVLIKLNNGTGLNRVYDAGLASELTTDRIAFIKRCGYRAYHHSSRRRCPSRNVR